MDEQKRDALIKAIAEGGEFDVTEGLRAIANRLTELDGLACGGKDALLTNVNGRAAGSTGGGKKK